MATKPKYPKTARTHVVHCGTMNIRVLYVLAVNGARSIKTHVIHKDKSSGRRVADQVKTGTDADVRRAFLLATLTYGISPNLHA